MSSGRKLLEDFEQIPNMSKEELIEQIDEQIWYINWLYEYFECNVVSDNFFAKRRSGQKNLKKLMKKMENRLISLKKTKMRASIPEMRSDLEDSKELIDNLHNASIWMAVE